MASLDLSAAFNVVNMKLFFSMLTCNSVNQCLFLCNFLLLFYLGPIGNDERYVNYVKDVEISYFETAISKYY